MAGRVWGFRGLGFGVRGCIYKGYIGIMEMKGLGLKVLGLEGLGARVVGFRVKGLGCEVWGGSGFEI